MIKSLLNDFADLGEVRRLSAENELLREREKNAVEYVRTKVNELLQVMGTLPLRQEELDDKTLLELDPIGIIAQSFTQVLQHLNETNEKLRVARDEIQAILTTAGVGILVVDAKMRINAYNAKLKELFLADQPEVMGQSCCRILCGTAAPPPNCVFERVMATKCKVQQPDWGFGDCHFEVSGSPIKNRFGDITHVVLVYSDMTDRKRTEDALRQSEEMYRSLFENADELIHCVDDEGNLVYANPAWLQTLGYTAHEVLGLSIMDVVHPGHRSQCREILNRLFAGEKIGRIETIFVAKDNSEVKVNGKFACSFKNGRPTAGCGIFRRLGS